MSFYLRNWKSFFQVVCRTYQIWDFHLPNHPPFYIKLCLVCVRLVQPNSLIYNRIVCYLESGMSSICCRSLVVTKCLRVLALWQSIIIAFSSFGANDGVSLPSALFSSRFHIENIWNEHFCKSYYPFFICHWSKIITLIFFDHLLQFWPSGCCKQGTNLMPRLLFIRHKLLFNSYFAQFFHDGEKTFWETFLEFLDLERFAKLRWVCVPASVEVLNFPRSRKTSVRNITFPGNCPFRL